GYLIPMLGWRWVFVIFGSVGLVWAVAFWCWFRNDPSTHPAVNPAERDLIGSGGLAGGTHHESSPWRAVLGNRSIWTLGAIMVFSAFNTYVYYSWFPKYLIAARECTTEKAGLLSSLVLSGGAIGTLLGGFLADYISRPHIDRKRVRRLVCGGCYFLSAVLLWLGMQFGAAWLTALCAGLSCLALASTLSTWWAFVFEVSGKH